MSHEALKKERTEDLASTRRPSWFLDSVGVELLEGIAIMLLCEIFGTHKYLVC
jgi:hypothetical protein